MPLYRATKKGFAKPEGEPEARLILAGEKNLQFSKAPGSWVELMDGEAEETASPAPTEKTVSAARARANKAKGADE